MVKVEIFKKDGELKSKYEKVLNLIKSGEKIFHLKYYAGNGRFIHTNDTEYNNMIDVLNYYNLKFDANIPLLHYDEDILD